MPNINISHESDTNKVTRADVQPFEVFVVKGKSKRYMHIGEEAGVFKSLNIDSGNVADTRNGKSRVEVIGKGELSVVLHDDYR